MSGRHLTGIIVSSALITFDGTAVIVALPRIAGGLNASFQQAQWFCNAPLLALAVLLLPAGLAADRYGRVLMVRAGLLAFGAASLVCAVTTSASVLMTMRLLQGIGGALILPAAVALLRAAYSDPARRARKFGTWAAWTGVASAVGPLLGGGLADVLSWRAVFLASTGLAAVAIVLMGNTGDVPGENAVECREQRLLPRELLNTRNCIPANSATFALYFGMFGLSFLLVLYTQQALGYSGVWAGAGILPISLMLFLAEPFARITPRVGTRRLVAIGSILAAAGILWMATAPHPLAYWAHIIAGTSLFGLGISLTASPLTHAAVSAVPENLAGAASGLNHAIVRAAGLLAIGLLGFVASDERSAALSIEGFKRAMFICGGVVAAGGLAGALRMRNEEPGGLQQTAVE